MRTNSISFICPSIRMYTYLLFQNDCNVGYAFVNFVSPSFLKEFYLEFHNKKWKKYKSPKICNISYALYQGTLELANHFRHSKILQHKDRKLKPLIGIAEASRIRDIEEMVRIQQEREWDKFQMQQLTWFFHIKYLKVFFFFFFISFSWL